VVQDIPNPKKALVLFPSLWKNIYLLQIGNNLVADEADSFFDDLGVSDTPSKGGNTLRESVTSLRSSTANQFV